MTRKPNAPFGFLAALFLALMAQTAQAGLFDDTEARQQIADFKKESEQKFDTQSQGQLELATQIMGLREELARLRGQIETLSYEIEKLGKRQNDFYLELDGRLSRLESGGRPSAQTDASPDHETDARQIYEQALNLFKNGKYQEAVATFTSFVEDYPDHEMAPSAQFWLGNTLYAQSKCKEAVDAQQVVLSRWPASSRAPDALLAIANCQRDLGNNTAYRRTLSGIVSKYPGSKSANEAQQRLLAKDR